MTEVGRIRDYFEAASWRPSPGRDYLVRERTAMFHAIVAGLRRSYKSLAICDVGCSTGDELVAWRDLGVPASRLAGTELVPSRAEIARERLPEADIRVVEGFDLPFASGSFDVCTAALVLSTIAGPAQRRRLLTEMLRITRPGGLVVIYDFVIRKPWNRNVVAVATRDLASVLGRPIEVQRAAPFLPFLTAVLRLPDWIARRLIRILPRTHRIWVWSR